MTTILPLDTNISALEILGGKGKSLASLIKAGFSVPGGFSITTDAYREFIAANDLQPRIVAAMKPEVVQGVLSFEGAAKYIQTMFKDGAFSEEMVAALTEAQRELSETSLAVRSSATAEDLPNLSFAGQQDTYLNVRGVEAIVEAVRNCWASLWTARSIIYRHQMGIDHDQVAMAVVVQRMVAADVSGVFFTANPATGHRDELVVNASYGLGEAIVSGEVTPDSYLLDRETLNTKTKVIGAKERMVIANPDQGTTLAPVDAFRRNSESMSTAQIIELARIALKVEHHFDGVPQDIEWLFADGRLWLLQSRPITNLPLSPLQDVRWDQPEPGAYLGRSQLVEHIPEPVSTLFEDLHMKRSLQYYWGRNLTRRGNHDLEDTQPPYSFVVQDTINGFAYRHLGEPPRTGRFPDAHNRQWLPAKVVAWFRVPLWFRTYFVSVPTWRYRSLPSYLRQIKRWAQLTPSDASVEQLWAGMREMSKADARYWYNDGVWNAFALTRGTEYQLNNFLQEHSPGRYTSGQFLSGLPSAAYDAQVSLWRIAKDIQGDHALYDAVIRTSPHSLLKMLRDHPKAHRVREGIDQYVAAYGHQIFTLDFAHPLERERPLNLMRSLLSLILQSDYDPIEKHRALGQKRRTIVREALQFFKGRKRLEFIALLWRARHFYPNREEAMFHMGKACTVFRPFAKELGRRLVEDDTRVNADDIYFLTTGELSRAIRAMVVSTGRLAKMRPDVKIASGIPEYRHLAVERRQLREARRRLTAPVAVPGPPLWAPPKTEDEEVKDANVLKGSAVSPGYATAQASVLMSPDDFNRMKPGTILVCPTTTPAWTQLFPQAKGLVTDIGGILAHGSIVAREYGIPAVLGLGDATKRIKDGQTITIDGNRGTVVIVDA
ncbi:MAG: PEP/pyruvate-binding domain-containing protein [Pseudomonadota bacterium]|nr:PEP/pyruvate-binding domain-containing protein [Pseudomonadota bacterium]